MAGLTVEELRAFITTDLSDAALQILLDASWAAIGTATAVDELISARGELLLLSRPASAITAVVERGVTLDTADYDLRSDGVSVRRLRTGTWPYAYGWRGLVDISYTANISQAEVERVQLGLVQLDIAALAAAPVAVTTGLTSLKIGEVTEEYATGESVGAAITSSREALLASLNRGVVGIY